MWIQETQTERKLRFIDGRPLPPPSTFESLAKRAIVSAYCWHLISTDYAQHLVDRYSLWRA